MGKITTIQNVEEELDRVKLIEQWRELYGCFPPKYLPLHLVQSTLAWEEQVNALGGLPIEVQRALKVRYTRKSSEEGLEQEFNSLDAQREACEAYIASQKHEGCGARNNVKTGHSTGHIVYIPCT